MKLCALIVRGKEKHMELHVIPKECDAYRGRELERRYIPSKGQIQYFRVYYK